MTTFDESDYTVVASDGDRELLINFSDRVTCDEVPGALVKAAIVIRSTGEVREQTIYEPNYTKRRPSTIARRLHEWDEDVLTPQRITG